MANTTLDTNTSCPEPPEAMEPDFDKTPLLPVIAQCAESKVVLMLAYMNKEAWQKTLESGEAHYYSRSRKRLWHKGESSGHVQKIKSIRLDCDRDTILLLVEQKGEAACHAGYQSCFYRECTQDGSALICSPRIFDPKEVYK